MNGKLDKKIWILWAEGRVNKEFEAIKTPIGNIPKYEDLKMLFKRELNKDYSQEEYVAQFSIRTDKYLEKMQRMKEIFNNIDMPAQFTDEMEAQITRLNETKNDLGSVISPFDFK